MSMSSRREMALLVGDNPFHGISHLSQQRARVRGDASNHIEYAADLIVTSVNNGANGFMFSVSDTTLSILKVLRKRGEIERLSLYAIIPYAYEYVRLANQLGGILGLGKKFAKEILASGDLRALAFGLKGVLWKDPLSILKAYLSYEISRVRSSAGRQANLQSVLLHQLVTDMALGLNLDSIFRVYVEFARKLGVAPGFNTGNFPYLVKKFREWNIDLHGMVVAAPFNKVGFQMTPSRVECEEALKSLPESSLIAISVLGAGYLTPAEAIDYVATLPNVKGVAVGVSRESHACETFRLLEEKMCAQMAEVTPQVFST